MKKSKPTTKAKGSQPARKAPTPAAATGRSAALDDAHVLALLRQALETELGGVEVYTTALECARNADLRKEWTKYLDQTKRHVKTLQSVFEKLGLDPAEGDPGRRVVRHIGESLVDAMKMAQDAADKGAAEIVAAECVTLAETKDHLNWELIGEVAKVASGPMAKLLKDAQEEIEDQEDEHLYHSQGWTRELWMQALGRPAALPPPEEEQDVKTASAAAKAKKERAKYVEKAAT